MLNLNKLQDAGEAFLAWFRRPIAQVADEVGQTADAAEKSIQALTPEVRQALDALEKIGPVCDSAAATLREAGQTLAEVRQLVADIREYGFETQTRIAKPK